MTGIVRFFLTALPKVALSRIFGVFARIPLPRLFRPIVHGAYAMLCGVDRSEVPGTLRDYPTLQAFFQRPVPDGARPVAAGAPVVWPCDGKVLTAGPIEHGRIPQIKGVDYGLDELLGDDGLAAALDGGTQATIYLAPSGYHRVHVPYNAELSGRLHIRGTLFPTNPPAVRSIRGLYPRNERVVHRFRLVDDRPAAVVMVAAFNVGDIQPSCGTTPTKLVAGQELARFGLGSTTVLLLPPGEPAIDPSAQGRFVHMGGAVPLTLKAVAESTTKA